MDSDLELNACGRFPSEEIEKLTCFQVDMSQNKPDLT